MSAARVSVLAAGAVCWLSGTAACQDDVPAWAVGPARLEAISRRYLGTPYALDCLGEATPPDADPLFTRRRADCQSLIEQTLAEALAPWLGGLEAAATRIRYRDGKIARPSRFHFCVPDWLEHPWPVRDVTSQLAAGAAETIRRELNPTTLKLPPDVCRALPVSACSMSMLPRKSALTRAVAVPAGSIVAFVSPRRDLMVSHLGFVFDVGAARVLRHASSTRRRVLDEPLTAYLQARSDCPGLMVLQPDVAGLRRAATGR